MHAVSGFTIPEIEPGYFPSMHRLVHVLIVTVGKELYFDERLVVPDQTLRIKDGALAPWRKGKSPYFLQTIEAIAKHFDFDPQLDGRLK